MFGLGLTAAGSGCLLTTDLSGLAGNAGAAPLDATVNDVVSPSDARDVTEAGTDADAPESSTPYPSVVMSDQPAAYYRLGETSGTVATDETGHHTGTYQGGVMVGVPGALAGSSNPAILLDGTSGFVSIGNTLDFTAGAPFSLEAWVKPMPVTSGVTRIVCKRAPMQGYSIYIEPAGLVFEMYRDNANAKIFGPVLASDAFTHVVATYDGSTERLFVNGAQVGTTPSTIMLSVNTGLLNIGSYSGSGSGDWYSGVIDEVALYAAALPPARVLAHYRAGKGP